LRLAPGASTFVARGQAHRLSNPGEDWLEIVEVQTGEPITEDDIERLDDHYGRAGQPAHG